MDHIILYVTCSMAGRADIYLLDKVSLSHLSTNLILVVFYWFSFVLIFYIEVYGECHPKKGREVVASQSSLMSQSDVLRESKDTQPRVRIKTPGPLRNRIK